MTTKEQDEKKDEGPFRTVAVSFSKSPQEFAAKLEEAMNALSKDDYHVQMVPIPRGMVLVGRKREKERESILGRLLGMAAIGGPASSEMPERVAALLSNIESKISTGEDMEKEIPKVMPQVLKGVPIDVIQDVAKECEEWADSHERSHSTDADHDSNCRLSPVLRAVAREMRGYTKLHVQ